MGEWRYDSTHCYPPNWTEVCSFYALRPLCPQGQNLCGPHRRSGRRIVPCCDSNHGRLARGRVSVVYWLSCHRYPSVCGLNFMSETQFRTHTRQQVRDLLSKFNLRHKTHEHTVLEFLKTGRIWTVDSESLRMTKRWTQCFCSHSKDLFISSNIVALWL